MTEKLIHAIETLLERGEGAGRWNTLSSTAGTEGKECVWR